jgi:hypothetical protein
MVKESSDAKYEEGGNEDFKGAYDKDRKSRMPVSERQGPRGTE